MRQNTDKTTQLPKTASERHSSATSVLVRSITVQARKLTVPTQKLTVLAQKFTVQARKSTVPTQKSTVQARKSTVQARKFCRTNTEVRTLFFPVLTELSTDFCRVCMYVFIYIDNYIHTGRSSKFEKGALP
jgi:hypothetical protein